MYRLSIVTSFSAAHHLRHYQGRCENLHGHNWKVEVTVAARNLDRAGMGVDFAILKQATRQFLAQFDQKYLNDIEYFQELSPSSENIARVLFEALGAHLNTSNVSLEEIRVWESEKAAASYSLV